MDSSFDLSDKTPNQQHAHQIGRCVLRGLRRRI